MSRNLGTQKAVKQERYFLAVVIVFGFLWTFLTPPFQIPDEDKHLFRAYMLSNGQVPRKTFEGIQGTFLPQSLQFFGYSFGNIPFHPSEKVRWKTLYSSAQLTLNNENLRWVDMGPYLPLPYLPQAMGIGLGRLLNLSPLLLLFLGRLFNLGAWIFLIHRAIKTTPIFKWVFCLLALTPMSLFLAASLSYDAFTNGICFLWIAWCLSLAFGEESFLNKNKLGWTFLLTALVALSKHVYIFLALLFFLIPRSKFGSTKRYCFSLFSIFTLNATALFSWYFWVVFPRHSSLGAAPFEGKLASMFNDPASFAILLLKTIHQQGLELGKQFLGILGWLDTPLPGFIYLYLGCLILLTACVDNNRKIILGWKHKLILAIIFFGNAAFMITAMHLSWQQDTLGIISGIQGRYFIPLSPVFCLLFYNQRLQPAPKEAGLRWISILAIVPTLLVTSWFLCKRYYQ